MLKKILLIPLFMLLCLPMVVKAEEKLPTPSADYQATQIYKGIYKPERIYTLNRYEDIWYGDRQFKTLTAISCSAARVALNNKGIWVGNLTDKGGCAGQAEPATWAIGNYLNYLVEKPVAPR